MFKSTLLSAFAVFLLAIGLATPSAAFEPGNTECIAPANPGGGWDFTCRQVGKVLADLKLVPGQVQVTNMPGAGGGVAYGYVVSKRGDDSNLIVAASTATTTRLAQGQFIKMKADMVRWVGSLGADYGVLAVKADSPIKSLGDFVQVLKNNPSSISIGGGSAAGGFDHLKVLQVAKAGGVRNLAAIKYVAFSGGGEAITQVLGGHLQAFTGDITEIQGHLKSGDLRAIAVLSEERLPGDLGSVPTGREQGIDVVAPNWRGFYLPGKVPDDVYNYWAGAVSKVYRSSEWQDIMRANGLMPFFKVGKDFQGFVHKQIADINELSKEIGIIK